MPPKKLKTRWDVVMEAATGTVSTLAFRLVITIIGGWLVLGGQWAREIYRLPDQQRQSVKELQKTIDESIKSIKEAEETARQSLVTKTDLLQQIAEWQKQRDALNVTVESHTKHLLAQDGKLEEIAKTGDKILELLTKERKTASNEH